MPVLTVLVPRDVYAISVAPDQANVLAPVGDTLVASPPERFVVAVQPQVTTVAVDPGDVGIGAS